MTDISHDSTTPKITLRPQPSTAALLLGPVCFAWRESWAAFWVVVALDVWAMAALMNGATVLALSVLLAGRVLILLTGSRFLAGRLISSHGDASEAKKAPKIAISAYLLSLALVALSGLRGEEDSVMTTFPEWRALGSAAANAVDAMVRQMTITLAPFFQVIKMALLTLLETLETALIMVPWPVYFLLVGFMGWQRGGWRVMALGWAALAYLGIFGFWDKAISTSSLVLAAVAVSIVVGVPLGVWAAKRARVNAVLEPILDFMQTLPSFVYLLPAVAFFSIGKPPALIATVIFSVPPLIRLTNLGIRQVPGSVHEAMYAHGATPLQTLFKAELPLALPSIQAGVNQCIMMSLSMVVIASLIGGGGLGYDVLFALQNVQHGRGLLAGIAIVALAMTFDRLVRSSPDKTRH